MKKLKLFLALLICVLCICPAFAGCSTNNAEYLENSFTYEIESFYDYSNSQYFSCSFNIKIKKLGKYKVEYTLYGDYLNDNNYKWRKNFSSQITSEVTDSYKVSEYSYASTDTKTRTIIIKDIKITEVKDEALYTDIALALGVSAAVLTATAVTLFILEKKGIIKSKKHSSE